VVNARERKEQEKENEAKEEQPLSGVKFKWRHFM
jgi:hypothetical protein